LDQLERQVEPAPSLACLVESHNAGVRQVPNHAGLFAKARQFLSIRMGNQLEGDDSSVAVASPIHHT